MYIRTYKAPSPRRTDDRLGSGHARDDRGCRQIEAVNVTAVLPRGTLHQNETCLSEEQKKTLDSMNQQQMLPSGTRIVTKYLYQSSGLVWLTSTSLFGRTQSPGYLEII